ANPERGWRWWNEHRTCGGLPELRTFGRERDQHRGFDETGRESVGGVQDRQTPVEQPVQASSPVAHRSQQASGKNLDEAARRRTRGAVRPQLTLAQLRSSRQRQQLAVQLVMVGRRSVVAWPVRV